MLDNGELPRKTVHVPQGKHWYVRTITLTRTRQQKTICQLCYGSLRRNHVQHKTRKYASYGICDYCHKRVRYYDWKPKTKPQPPPEKLATITIRYKSRRPGLIKDRLLRALGKVTPYRAEYEVIELPKEQSC